MIQVTIDTHSPLLLTAGSHRNSKVMSASTSLPDDRRDEEARLAKKLQGQLSTLLESYACNICHATLTAPVTLPCHHLFCSECIRKHLIIHSVCPHPHCDDSATSRNLTAFRQLDAALEPLRRAAASQSQLAVPSACIPSDVPYLVFLSAKEPGAKSKLMEKLRECELPFAGNVNLLARRYRQFVLKWNANLDAAVPQSRPVIANLVMKEERLRDAKTTPTPNNRTSAFFKKPRVAVSAAKVPESDDVVAAGDDFDTLIRKTQIRKMKRMREAQREARLNASPSCKKSRTDNQNENQNESGALSPPLVASPPLRDALSFASHVCTVDIEGKSGGSFQYHQAATMQYGCVNARIPNSRPAMYPPPTDLNMAAASQRRHRISPPQRQSGFVPASQVPIPATSPFTPQPGQNNRSFVPQSQMPSTLFPTPASGQSFYTSGGNNLALHSTYENKWPSTTLSNCPEQRASPPRSQQRVEMTEEMKRNIERKRLIAKERQKKRIERLRLLNAQSSQPE